MHLLIGEHIYRWIDEHIPKAWDLYRGRYVFGFCGLTGSYWLVNAAHAHTQTLPRVLNVLLEFEI